MGREGGGGGGGGGGVGEEGERSTCDGAVWGERGGGVCFFLVDTLDTATDIGCVCVNCFHRWLPW